MAGLRGYSGAQRESRSRPREGGRGVVRSDRQLVAAAQRGDAAAFEALAGRHQDTILNVAFRTLGDREAAEDVTQDALVRLHTALPGFRGDAEVKTWLFRVTLNLCHDHGRRLRRRGTELGLHDTPSEPAMAVRDDPHGSLDVGRARGAIEAAIQRLPETQREAVLLRFVADLSYAEIAEITGVPAGTVASRVFRGLKRLGSDVDPRHAEAVR